MSSSVFKPASPPTFPQLTDRPMAAPHPKEAPFLVGGRSIVTWAAMQNVVTFLAVLALTTLAGMGGLLAVDSLGVADVGLVLLAAALVVLTVRFLRS